MIWKSTYWKYLLEAASIFAGEGDRDILISADLLPAIWAEPYYEDILGHQFDGAVLQDTISHILGQCCWLALEHDGERGEGESGAKYSEFLNSIDEKIALLKQRSKQRRNSPAEKSAHDPNENKNDRYRTRFAEVRQELVRRRLEGGSLGLRLAFSIISPRADQDDHGQEVFADNRLFGKRITRELSAFLAYAPTACHMAFGDMTRAMKSTEILLAVLSMPSTTAHRCLKLMGVDTSLALAALMDK